VTEEKLREHFQSCGKLKEVNILKKPDGKLVGCAFVQFDTVQEAAKAVRELNLKPFLGKRHDRPQTDRYVEF
jgi:nucleolar protein 4